MGHNVDIAWTSLVRAIVRALSIFFIAIATATPLPRFQPPALSIFRSTHLCSSFKILMRPTGEASKPVSGDFDCRLVSGSSSSVLRRRRTERLGSGVSRQRTLTGRFREGKLVVSAWLSKWFFRPK